MTWPHHLLSLNEWATLPAEEDRRCELVIGVLIVSPSPTGRHQRAILRVAAAIDAQLPDELTALPEAELVIAAGPAATVRVPDILVTRYDLVAEQDLARYSSCDIGLVVEVVSPGSRSTDQVFKLAEYARAGIPSYWILDLESKSITVLELEQGEYAVRSNGGTVDVTLPAPLHLNLADVLARR